MVSLRFLFVFASAVTAIPTLSRRDPQQILQDLQGIDTSVKSMTQAVQGWSGSLIAALSIKSQADNVGVSQISPNVLVVEYHCSCVSLPSV